MKQRPERMQEIIRKAAGSKLVELFPKQYVTVTQVDVSPDFRNATVWIHALHPEQDLLVEIRNNQKHFKEALKKYVDTKFTPRLSFRLDERYDHASRIDEVLRQLGH